MPTAQSSNYAPIPYAFDSLLDYCDGPSFHWYLIDGFLYSLLSYLASFRSFSLDRMVCSRLYSTRPQEEKTCGCFIRTSEGRVRRICSGGKITRRKLILLLLASLVFTVGASVYPRQQA